jgi:hypothetical protein
LSSVAATLVEATPFLLAGSFACRVLPRGGAWVPYLGCGCGAASARSLPAAALTLLAFGPAVAAARVAAAVAIDRRLLHARAHAHAPNVLAELEALLPGAIAAAAVAELAARVDLARVAFPLQLAAGVALGFFSPPCAVGAAAFSAALHAHAPAAAAAFLCVAGIADLRTLLPRHARERAERDVFAYAATALACATVAIEGGAGLVRPALGSTLAACAIAFCAYAVRYRESYGARTRIAPVVMLAGALGCAPPASYYATETTLAQLFAGERLTFTGVLTSRHRSQAVVRYAMTCCRADAAPVAVRLASPLALPAGSWVRVEGAVIAIDGEFALRPERAAAIAPPADPFIYR